MLGANKECVLVRPGVAHQHIPLTACRLTPLMMLFTAHDALFFT